MFGIWKKQKDGDRDGGRRRGGGGATQASRPVRQTAGYALGPETYEVSASVLSDVGCRRDTNEDCGRYVGPEDPRATREKGALLLVADGVGGNRAGEVASRLAADTIGRVFYAHEGDAQASLVRAFREANRQIQRAASSDRRLRGMGTTCSALAVGGGRAVSANVGDSRLYLVRGGEIYLMTEDDSVVGSMVKHGLITRQQARQHPDKNVIVSALGAAPEVSIATWGAPLPVRAGDYFVVCSDGLYDLVSDAEMREAVTSAEEPGAACRTLVALARERGGHDNITVGVLGVRPAPFVG